MNTTTNLNDELNKVLKALFLEKKKVKALEERLQKVSQKGPVETPSAQAISDMHKMRELLLALKQKYAEALTSLKKYESKEAEEESLRIQVSQLKSTLLPTQKKLINSEEENQALKGQLEHVKALLTEARQTAMRNHEEVIKTYQRQLAESLEKARHNVTSAEEESHSLRVQLAELKTLHDDAQSKISRREYDLREALERSNEYAMLYEELKRENAQLKLLLEEVPVLKHREQESLIRIRDLNAVLELTQEQNSTSRQSIDRFTHILQEKDKRLLDLHELEKNFKHTHEQNELLESSLEQQKNAYQELLTQKQNLETSLSESKRHADQLERVIQFLRERAEEAHLQVNQLQEEFQSSRQKNQELSQKLETSNVRSSELEQLLDRAVKGKQQVVDELTAIQNQFEQLKSKLSSTQNAVEVRDATLKEAYQQIDLIKNEKQGLEALIEEKSVVLSNIENELDLIKQKVERAVSEAKEIETRYQEAVNEKVTALNKADQLQHQYDNQSEEIRILRDQVNDAAFKENSYKAQLETLAQIEQEKLESFEKNAHLQECLNETSKRLDEATQSIKNAEEKVKYVQNQIAEKENIIVELHSQISDMRRGREQLEQDILGLSRLCEEKDADIRMAQQHLAKKMKETAFLSEQIESQKVENIELESNLSSNKIKVAELQALLDAQNQHEKRLQQDFHERMKSAETQIHKWEEKYFLLQQKWEEVDGQLRELKNIQDKYHQVQAFVANLGLLMGPVPQAQVSIAAPQKSSIPVIERPNLNKVQVEESPEERRQKSYDLFEIPESEPHVKQSLFD